MIADCSRASTVSVTLGLRRGTVVIEALVSSLVNRLPFVLVSPGCPGRVPIPRRHRATVPSGSAPAITSKVACMQDTKEELSLLIIIITFPTRTRTWTLQKSWACCSAPSGIGNGAASVPEDGVILTWASWLTTERACEAHPQEEVVMASDLFLRLLAGPLARRGGPQVDDLASRDASGGLLSYAISYGPALAQISSPRVRQWFCAPENGPGQDKPKERPQGL